ncbi:MAG: hypothetical protein ACXWIZ_00405 [Caldimonas sp.]
MRALASSAIALGQSGVAACVARRGQRQVGLAGLVGHVRGLLVLAEVAAQPGDGEPLLGVEHHLGRRAGLGAGRARGLRARAGLHATAQGRRRRRLRQRAAALAAASGAALADAGGAARAHGSGLELGRKTGGRDQSEFFEQLGHGARG